MAGTEREMSTHIAAAGSGLTTPSSSITDMDLEEARQRLLLHQQQEHNRAATERDDPFMAAAAGYDRAASTSAAARVGNNYGSITSLQSQQHVKPTGAALKRFRLPFLILLGFDFALVVFLSVIVFVEQMDDRNNTEPLSFSYSGNNTAYMYFQLNLNSSMFDLVVLSTGRVSLSIFFYLILSWITRAIMGFTTVVSSLYIPIKVYMWWQVIVSTKDVLLEIPVLVMFFTSFAMPWLTAFFFEFKYLPAEKSRLRYTGWDDWRAWLWPRALVRTNRDYLVVESIEQPQQVPAINVPSYQHPHPHPHPHPLPPSSQGRSSSTLSLEFRTPMGSSRASPICPSSPAVDDLPPISEESPLTAVLSIQDQQYIEQAPSILNALIEHTESLDGWRLEKSTNGVTCYSKQGPDRKIWRVEGDVDIAPEDLWDLLYTNSHTTPEWNPRCESNVVIYSVNKWIDVLYTVTSAMGPVSSRDFVSLRYGSERNGCYYSASAATTIDSKPDQQGRVRGENGPGGYVVVTTKNKKSRFIWVLNSDLKGWLPQSVIDHTLSSTLIDSFSSLKRYIAKL